MHANNRIKLLSDSEINDIYAFPFFNEVEQPLYFEFTDHEMDIAKKYRTIKAQFMLIKVIVQCQQNKRTRYCGIAKNQFATFMEAICFDLKRLSVLDPPDLCLT